MKTLPAFNPGTIVQFKYRGEPDTRTVTYDAMKASAEPKGGKPRTWLLCGHDALRGGEYRAFHWSKITDLQIVGRAE